MATYEQCDEINVFMCSRVLSDLSSVFTEDNELRALCCCQNLLFFQNSLTRYLKIQQWLSIIFDQDGQTACKALRFFSEVINFAGYKKLSASNLEKDGFQSALFLYAKIVIRKWTVLVFQSSWGCNLSPHEDWIENISF